MSYVICYCFIELQVVDNGGKSVTLSNGVVVNPKDEVWIHMDQCMVEKTIFAPYPTEFRSSRWLPYSITKTIINIDGNEVVKEVEEGSLPEKLEEMEKFFIGFGHGARICPGTVLQYCYHLILTTFIMIFKHLIIGY